MPLQSSPDSVQMGFPFGGETHFFADNPHYCPLQDADALGMRAEPLAYQLQRDDVVTGILFFCFLLMTYVLSRGRRVFHHQFKNFFYEMRQRSGLFVEESGSERRYALLLFLPMCLMWALLLFRFKHPDGIDSPSLPSHYLFLAGYTLLFAAYYTLRHALYSMVNWVFFPHEAREMWVDAGSLLTCLQSVLLFPFVLLMVYFTLPDEWVFYCVLGIVGIVQLLRFYKSSVIFFAGFHRFLYNFLYLCTLETVPLLALCKLLACVP